MLFFTKAQEEEQEELMIDNIITPGDRVELKSVVAVTLDDGTEGKKLYRTRITDVRDDGRLEIAMPMEKTKLVLLQVDQEFEACFFTTNGMYRANLRIVDRSKVDNQYLLLAECITALSKFQRREYYRFPCIIEAKVKNITLSQAHAINQNLSFLVPMADGIRGVIVDISGGGVRFISKSKFETDSLIQLQFELKTREFEDDYILVGKVVASNEIPNRENEYENRVMFVDLNTTVREEIIRYIFEEERKNRKNKRR